MIATVREQDIPELLPLVLQYCAFYGTRPAEEDLTAMARSLVSSPEAGLQLVWRDPAGTVTGFATLLWGWDTTVAGTVGIMQDLFVVPHARGRGIADALIAGCASRARAHGCRHLVWQTAPDNRRAQAVYERTGALASPCSST